MLKNKIALITGAGRGIGRAIAIALAKEGAEVVINYNGSEERAKEVKQTIEENGGKASIYKCNVSDFAACEAMIKDIVKEYGHLDILVNNAGIEFNELIGMISRDNMEKMFNVNVFGAIEMLQTVSRVMARNEKGGSIINISSMVGLRGNRGQLVYSATKGAIIALTKSAAKELADKNIRVNSIAPGITQTAMMEQADLDKLQDRIHNICMGRIAQPRDIAGGCLLLASDYASYISGQVLPVDGCTIM